MDTPTMGRCTAFLHALHALPTAEWSRRASAGHAPPAALRAAVRAGLERRCDAFELWSLRDDVETLCWRLPPSERTRLREAIADAALAILAGVSSEDANEGALLGAFADLVPEESSAARQSA